MSQHVAFLVTCKPPPDYRGAEHSNPQQLAGCGRGEGHRHLPALDTCAEIGVHASRDLMKIREPQVPGFHAWP